MIISFTAIGQNLVPNQNFGNTINCPLGLNNTQVLTDWFNPTGASPDYYNFCATNASGVGIPLNLWGHQFPQIGNAYISLVTYASPSVLPEYREYMEVQLIEPLVTGKLYHWCMWISPADSANLISNNIGISLSDTMVTDFSSQTILNSVVYANYLQITTDNLGWTEIAGSFTAQGGEEYLILGNFFNDTQTNTVQIGQNTLNGEVAAYYIDIVYLGEISCLGTETETEIEITIPNVVTPNEDGNNDLFRLDFPFNKVEIYNRWGQKIFETKDNDAYWDGRTTAGKEVLNGTYFYVIKIKDETYKGYLELLR